MKILFLHGLESKPGGTKPSHLAKYGYEVLNPALPKEDFSKSLEIAQSCIDLHEPDIVVGSSRGGAVAAAINKRGAQLVLIAPAWKLYGVNPIIETDTTVIHCPTDKIVPFVHSEELSKIAKIDLVSCGKCHRMNDTEALDALLEAVS